MPIVFVLLALVAGSAAAWVAWPRPSVETRATAVTRAFFDAMTTRHWEDACALLSTDFYTRNNLDSPRVCYIALQLGFTMRENFVFSLDRVERRGGNVLVHATADGQPGVIRLVAEQGDYRIDSLIGE